MKFNRFFVENIRISWSSIRGNKLRANMTISIIAIGIMALVGIVTATDAIKNSIADSFSQAGVGSFEINSRYDFGSSENKRRKRNSRITFEQATKYKQLLLDKSTVTIDVMVSRGATVKFESQKSDPNISVSGIDEDFFAVNNMSFQKGRNFTPTEVETNQPVAIIGTDVVQKLFLAGTDPLGKQISISGKNFTVVGVKEPKGASLGMSADGIVYLPITTANAAFSLSSPNYSITTSPNDSFMVDEVEDYATGIMRVVRMLRPTDLNDFRITQSNSSTENMVDMISKVAISAYIIGFITLLGATVALMNIMLVTVNEKTREIGTRMALGAKKSSIKEQFLIESVIISQLGGFFGIIAGILIGNCVAMIIGSSFVVPWSWIAIGFTLSLSVGILSGYLPAVKASKLDPIEALRYE